MKANENKLSLLISAEQIQQKICETARLLELDYRDKDLVIVAVMKGAICLVADLIRELNLPLTLQTILCSSYGALGFVRGDLTIFGTERLQIKDKDVLIVDDMFDSGCTIQGLYDALAGLAPRSVKSCVLLEKNISRSVQIRPDYTLFNIENDFVVGYGLDYKELYRGLSSIYTLAP